MSRKTERLVNLTIALLATKRYLTKSEIFRTLEGYEGSAETKERMFERDKDDLRALGIEIEVGSFDPIFEDEPGYRIRPDSYRFQLEEITPVDISLLSLAASAWRGAALDSSALSALVKLHSIGVESDFDALPALSPHVANSSAALEVITHALTAKNEIHFSYTNEDLSVSERKIRPYACASTHGNWYVVGFDMDKEAIRTFKVSRIADEIIEVQISKGFDIPSDFQLEKHLAPLQKQVNARLLIRPGKAHALRAKAQHVTSNTEWDEVDYPYIDESRAIEEILWHGNDVIVIEPLHLRDHVITSLKKLVASHE